MHDMLSLLDKLKIKFRHIISPHNELVDLAENFQSVCDIGCGLGVFLSALSGKGKILHGVEISQSLVEKANKHMQMNKILDVTVSHFNGSPLTIPSLKESDVCFLNDVLHHVPEQLQKIFLNEIYNQMKSGSKFILKDIDAASKLVYFNKIHDLVLSQEYPHEMPLN